MIKAPERIDLQAASIKLNNIVIEKRKVIEEAKESIKNSSENQRQPDSTDVASLYSEMVLNTALIRRSEQTIAQCAASLNSVKKGDYGLCSSCEDEIEPRRLMMTPYLDKCASCSKDIEDGKHRTKQH